jgi:hypothetical protein
MYVCMYACMLSVRSEKKGTERTVLSAKAVDGSDEVAMELAGPPEPGHLGPVVPPRRRPVPPAAAAAAATHLAHARSASCWRALGPASSLSVSRLAPLPWCHCHTAW